jgi:hypothetical protein
MPVGLPSEANRFVFANKNKDWQDNKFIKIGSIAA